MSAIELKAKKADLIAIIMSGINTEEALDQIDRFVKNMVSLPCQPTSEQILARAERAVVENENGETIPLDSLPRK